MYMLFAGASYYPRGGWDDFKGVFSSIEDAKAEYDKRGWEWGHVVCGMSVVHTFY